MIQSKNFYRHLISVIDFQLIFLVVALMFISFAAIYSASSNYGMSFKYLSVQLLAFSIGFLGFVLIVNFNYQYYKYLYKFIYILSFLLLFSVLIFGSVKRGTRGWFDFGFISFQPVEIAKIMFILSLASFLDRKSKETGKISFLISVFAMLTGHIILIMMQPDFSSTLSYFPVTLILLFIIGIEPFYLFCIIIFGSLSVGIPLLETFLSMQLQFSQNKTFLTNFLVSLKTGWVSVYVVGVILFLIISCWYFLWKLKIKIALIYPVILCASILLGCLSSLVVEKSLKDYQRKRLVVFLNPSFDPRDSGYNIIQSKIAIGSGKFIGKGFKKGTQTQLGFLPEQHTDFIFSVIAEEKGWIGAQITLFFYFFFVWRAFVIAKDARDRYGSLVAMGLANMFMFYIVINISMVMGIMPATGVPLPLLSYGGSSIFSSLCAVGILCSISMRKYTHTHS
ncbi:MAG: rod shape-determining protein RodA [Endomicrobiia bacterium]|nr:MAG: rod shape-determining protein RodA [Endomicrobiia bacterium]